MLGKKSTNSRVRGKLMIVLYSIATVGDNKPLCVCLFQHKVNIFSKTTYHVTFYVEYRISICKQRLTLGVSCLSNKIGCFSSFKYTFWCLNFF